MGTLKKMSIKGDVEELNKINAEIKRVLGHLRKLRITKRELERRVTEYLKEKELPGVKHQDIVIRLDTKPKQISKGKTVREQAFLDVLVSSGIANPREVMDRLRKAGKETKETDVLKINNINLSSL